MAELTWAAHRTQLTRQLNWQTVRNEFYTHLQSDGRRIASAGRALDQTAIAHPHSVSIPGKLSQQTQLEHRSLSAQEYYDGIVCPHDQSLKTAMRDGDAATHLALLDQSNEILRTMRELTYGSYTHETI